MDKIIIRKAEHKDIPELVNIRLDSLYVSHKRNKLLENNIFSYFNAHMNEDLDVIVAENDNGIIALYCVSFLTLLPRINSENNKSAYLSFYYIKHEYDKQLLRQKLYKEAINQSIRRKAEVFELGVPKNKIHIYQKYKFEISEFAALHLPLKDAKWEIWEIKDKNIKFRKATSSDIQDLVEMRIYFLNEVSGNSDLEMMKKYRLTLTEFLRQHLNNDVDAYVAESNGKIVSVSFTIYIDLIPGLNLINGKMGIPVNNYTLLNHRGANIGIVLFAFSGKSAQMRGAELFEMEIPKTCVDLYKKFGFVHNDKIPMQLRL